MGSLVSAGTVGTQHSVPLSGLPPATAFHAQAYSVNDDDTAWSSIQLYSTASPDPGNITVYFNKPVDISVATGPYAIDLGTAIDDTIKAYMDRALSTIDVAVYNTTSNLMVDAANGAHSRGVRVRWIAEASNSNTALQGLLPAIPVLYRTNSTGSGMHNKFVVVDADGGPDACVLTGSANFTNAGFFNDPNNLVVVRDMALARTYRSEFNEMWGGSGPQPEPANSRFGAAKADNTPHLFNVNGTLVQSWFSPSDGTTARIEAALRTADEHIEFALFALTSSDLTEALIDMAALPNMLVRGMVEEEDMNTTTYDALLNGGVDVRPDGAPSSLHHKYAIVDRASATLDPQVITGSHNWSFNAESTNDENTLIIHSALVADQFHQEWNARWTTAVSLPEQATSTNGPVVWPNPTTGLLHVALPDTGSNTIAQVVDMSGRTVHSSAMPKGHNSLSLEHLAPGSYVLRVGQDGRHAHFRFVIGR
jgi:phosphatidylserine/phosphatidylglycerophosphate/cardiolipin synthase-like enzyme